MVGSSTMLSINYMRNSYGVITEQDIKRTSYKLDKDTRDTFKALDGASGFIDTPEEFITAAYFSPVQIVDASALAAVEAVLPHSDPRTAGLKLGAMWYKKIVEMQFCDPTNTAQLANYELAIRTISERTGVSRADMVTFFRNGIKSVVAEAVDREFNTISFMIEKSGIMVSSYSSILTLNPQTGQYTLDYGGYFAGSAERQTKTISAASLDALLAEMRRRPEDFNETCIAAVRDNQTLIPGIVFADWKLKLAGNPDCLNMIKEVITNFYLSPTPENYNLLIRFSSRYMALNGYNSAFVPMDRSLSGSIAALSTRLIGKFSSDMGRVNIATASREPIPEKYNPLFTFAVGSGK